MTGGLPSIREERQVRNAARRLPLPFLPVLVLAVLALCLVATATARPALAQDSAGSSTARRAGEAAARAALARTWLARALFATAGAAQADADRAGTAQAGSTQVGITQSGLQSGGRFRSVYSAVSLARPASADAQPLVAPLWKLKQADLLIVAPSALPRGTAAKIRRVPGVIAAQRLDAARIRLNGKFVAMLGVNPSAFRGFAARPTARSDGLWREVAAGGIAVSYTMGKQDKIPLGRTVRVAGARTEKLRVGGFGTVGIAGVDAVVSDSVARSLGIPSGNAIVISAPHAELTALMARVAKLLPKRAAIAPLVAQAVSSGAAGSSSGVAAPSSGAGIVTASGAAGGTDVTAADGPGLSAAEVARFLAVATSRLGLPYIWGAAGPRAFDCSGLVQWSLAQAGVAMPRVAVDQARTGPQVPVSELRPGDLLFYHTDPTAPAYISHVAIYLGNGEMIQAPEPGLDVEVVPAIVSGPGFAGAVRVYPRVAAAVAGDLAG
jgi:peptidoglycan DL-endopeptidase CwlO